MNGVSRVGQDSAGGILKTYINSTVFVNGSLAAVLGNPVAGHGDPPHNAPTMVTASPTVYIGNVGVVRSGDSASCGHKATGSNNVFQ